MEFSYRCLTCGNNTVLISEQPEAPVATCEKCEGNPELFVVTDENRDSLPFPTNPQGLEDATDEPLAEPTAE